MCNQGSINITKTFITVVGSPRRWYKLLTSKYFHDIMQIKLKNAYTELKLIPIRLITIEKLQKLLDDLNTFIQLLQALQHRYLELTTEEIVDKLRLAREAKH